MRIDAPVPGRRSFGTLDGETVDEVALATPEGSFARVIAWGATLRDLVVAGPGHPQRIVLGLTSLDEYLRHSPHMGAVAGRFANRIRGGRFTLDGASYELPRNENGVTSLHGGGRGFGKRPWRIVGHDATSVALRLISPDGDAGYPGTVDATCVYRLRAEALRVELSATTDQATPLNLAHHSYFNLDGAPTILDHELTVAADAFTPVDEANLPTGEIRPVAGTAFDFRQARPVRLVEGGARRRYDHNWVLDRSRLDPSGAEAPLAFAARLRAPGGGLSMEVWTTEPGLQVYDGFKLDLPVPGLDRRRYGPCAGLCLEPQRFPDSPNQPHFPDSILRPGEIYRQVTEYRLVRDQGFAGSA